MPYIQEENKIITKVIGTTGSDEVNSIQEILKLLKEKKVTPLFFYLEGLDLIMVDTDKTKYKLGNIHSKYANVIFKKEAKGVQIAGYKVTGGWNLSKRTRGLNSLEFVDNKNVNPNLCAKYGLNIVINLCY